MKKAATFFSALLLAFSLSLPNLPVVYASQDDEAGKEMSAEQEQMEREDYQRYLEEEEYRDADNPAPEEPESDPSEEGHDSPEEMEQEEGGR